MGKPRTESFGPPGIEPETSHMLAEPPANYATEGGASYFHFIDLDHQYQIVAMNHRKQL